MVQHALSLTGKKIDRVVACTGPGSFTGVRIAVSGLKGYAVGEDIPCKSVSTLEALAYNARDLKGEYTLCVIIDAKCNRAYSALFGIKDGVITRKSEDSCMGFSELAKLLKGEENLLVFGDGAKLFVDENEEYQPQILSVEMNSVKAMSLFLASKNKAEISTENLSPLYIQLPKAERDRLNLR